METFRSIISNFSNNLEIVSKTDDKLCYCIHSLITTGSKFYIFPFEVPNPEVRKNKDFFVWKNSSRVETIKLLIKIGATLTILCLVIGWSIPSFCDNENKIELSEKIFLWTISLLVLFCAGAEMLTYAKFMKELTMALNSFLRMEHLFNFKVGTLGSKDQGGVLGYLYVLILYVPFGCIGIFFPTFLFSLFSENSVVRGTVLFYEELTLTYIHPEAQLILLIGIRIVIAIFGTLGIGHGVLYATGMVLLALCYSHAVTARFTGLRESLETGSPDKEKVKIFYRAHQVMNRVINDMCAWMWAYYYFSGIIIILVAVFALFRVPFSIFAFCLLIGLVQTGVSMHGLYIVKSVEMRAATADFMEAAKFQGAQNLFHKKYEAKFWVSCTYVSTWVGRWFDLESKDLVLRIYGEFMVDNLISLLVTFPTI